MKLPNLLSLQFSDSHFRAVIMIQCLLFCYNLKNLPHKAPFQLNVGDKDTVSNIEHIAQEQIKSLEHSLNLKSINLFLEGFFKNEQNWVVLL